ncbi:MAG: glycosyltransferase [Muribaculaceae bacterium]|nr:glycosyltransferase [Muribaculaceae bacterium]
MNTPTQKIIDTDNIPFSVCMCVYHKDNPSYFQKAVESINNLQTIKSVEIIIVVDGPIYGELEDIVSSYEKENKDIKVTRLTKNCGHAVARQTSIDNATNNIVAIMDADDIAIKERFEKQLNFLKIHPEIDVIGGQIEEFIDDIDNVVGKRDVPLNNHEIYMRMKSRCPFNQMTVMFRKDKVIKVGGYIDWFCNEDYYLWIRMAEAGCKFANLPDTLVNVRVGSDMYARRGGWKYFKSEKGLQDYMLKKKMISLPRYIFNVAVRFGVQVAMPNSIRGFIFQKLFRK